MQESGVVRQRLLLAEEGLQDFSAAAAGQVVITAWACALWI